MQNTTTNTQKETAGVCLTWIKPTQKAGVCLTWIDQDGPVQRPTVSLSLENLEAALT